MEHEESVQELSRLRQGDVGAYQELVSAYGPRLLAAAERLGHGPQEAEDLVQDAFLALVRSVDRFEGRSTLFTWLYRVLLNRHAELLRRSVLVRSNPPVPAGPVPAPEPGRDEQIRSSLRRLPEAEQRVLFLRYFEGLAYDEIAEILESPLGTVHAQAFHGLRRLRALMGDES